MLIAAVVRPAPSSASYTVSALFARWRSLRLTIVSRSPRASPDARNAANEEPYSTSRSSPRCHQTRCGMPCTSGCPPVAIDARQTGVSEGKVETPRRYEPCSSRKRSAGVSAASNIDGVRPSITIRTTGFRLSVTGQRAQPGVPLGLARAQPQAERGQDDGLDVADERHEGERRGPECASSDQRREAAARAAAPERAAHDRRRAEPARDPADEAADRLVPVLDEEADPDAGRGREQRREEPARQDPRG